VARYLLRTGVAFCVHGLPYAESWDRQKLGATRDCFFIKADLSKSFLKNSCADLVTNFWGSYCYLANVHSVVNFFASACAAVRPGGALYWELLQVEDLQDFNGSRFAEETGARVQNISGFRWIYTDVGGRHEMISPSLDFFLEVASNYFAKVSHWHDGYFMTHLVCEHRF
jgi:hypothetical protein